jgi:hypothetical protein
MSKKNRESVKQAIQELAIGNYNSYPEEYNTETLETASNIKTLAKGYWDCREEKEITRDEQLGIGLDDYTLWSQEAFVAFVKQHETSMN